MAARLEDKVALVTGGSSGIGRATALCFAGEGAKVVVADVNDEGGDETAALVRDKRGEAIFVKTDVSDAAQVENMIRQTVEAYGRLDYAFNNAGVGSSAARGLTHEVQEGAWDRLIDINLKGVWLCMKYELPQMLSQGHGAIVNTSSYNGLIATVEGAAYTAAKHGVVGLTKTAAIEYARSGIRVNAVCPGSIDTPLTQGIDAARVQAEIDKHPIDRIGRPEEIAEAVVWLCSDAASFVTGHAMSVDGGYVAQ